MKRTANKGLSSQGYGFSSGHIWMWELDYKESWAPENWCFWTVMLEKTLESPLDCKETKPVNPKGNQSWIFIEGLMLKLKLQYFGHLIRRTDSLQKTLMLGKIGARRRRGWPEDEMVGWHHWLNGHEFNQAPGVGYGQGILVCCSPWGHKELDTTERLNWLIWKKKKKWNNLPSISQWGRTSHLRQVRPVPKLPYVVSSRSKIPLRQLCRLWHQNVCV